VVEGRGKYHGKQLIIPCTARQVQATLADATEEGGLKTEKRREEKRREEKRREEKRRDTDG